jgi:hypothetical protein
MPLCARASPERIEYIDKDNNKQEGERAKPWAIAWPGPGPVGDEGGGASKARKEVRISG